MVQNSFPGGLRVDAPTRWWHSPETTHSPVVAAYDDALLPFFLAMVSLVLASAGAPMFVIDKPLAQDLGAEGRS